MKTKHFLSSTFLLAFLFITFSSCKKDSLQNCKEHSITACSQDPNKTNIRIKNISDYKFCNVIVNPSFDHLNCGNLIEGGQTCYRSVEVAYNYAYIQLFIGDKEFILQPYDFVGETALGVGNFTYLIDVTDYNLGKITVTVQAD